MDEPVEITQERLLPHARELVWVALTQPEWVEKWWAAGNIRPQVGHVFELDMGDFGPQRCIVIALEEPASFSFVFGADTLDTAIAWTLEDEEGQTRLTLLHSGFDTDTAVGMKAYRGMARGWPKVLDRLEAVLSEV